MVCVTEWAVICSSCAWFGFAFQHRIFLDVELRTRRLFSVPRFNTTRLSGALQVPSSHIRRCRSQWQFMSTAGSLPSAAASAPPPPPPLSGPSLASLPEDVFAALRINPAKKATQIKLTGETTLVGLGYLVESDREREAACIVIRLYT